MSRINLNNYEAFLLDYFEGNLDKELVGELKAFVISHPELDIDLDDDELPVFLADDIVYSEKETLLKKNDELPDADIINYIEGNLSSEQLKAFEERLSKDHQLALETELYKKTILTSDTTENYSLKEHLLKTEEEFVLNNRAVAYVEKQLSLKEKIEFQAELLVNENLRKDLQLAQKTKLIPNNFVVYPDKEELKKEARVVVLFSYRSVVAVAAALLLLIGLTVVLMNNNTNPVNKNNIANNSDSVKQSPSNKTHTNEIKEKEILPEQPSLNSFANNAPVKKEKNSQPYEIEKQAVKKDNETFVNNNTPQNAPVEKRTPEFVKDTATNYVANSLNRPENNNISSNNSVNTGSDKMVTHYTNANLLAQANDDETEQPVKKSFWKRAVTIAKQANVLGLKSVKGDEKSSNNYLLSFNSFSIEKK